VLASLAIPRFTEASERAKAAEAPRVLASFESAYLAAEVELGSIILPTQIIFDPASQSSKYFKYDVTGGGGSDANPPVGVPMVATATPEGSAAPKGITDVRSTSVLATATAPVKFTRACSGAKCSRLLGSWDGTN
jgi:hypothetical protein